MQAWRIANLYGLITLERRSKTDCAMHDWSIIMNRALQLAHHQVSHQLLHV
jgi:hypothetical protein